MLYNNYAKIFWERESVAMKNYTEPKLEIVTIKANDVITTSVTGSVSFFNLFKTTGIEDGGRASLNSYNIDK